VSVLFASIECDPLREHEVLERVTRDQAGAVVTFRGVVRDHDEGRDDVRGLEYSSHPDAESILRSVAQQVLLAHPDVMAMAVSHRVGALVVGDLAVVAAVSAAHRGVAFTACGELIERIKHEVPIWKHQSYADGTRTWSGISN
jgi:molybdopterin synthase catalytic subunit